MEKTIRRLHPAQVVAESLDANGVDDPVVVIVTLQAFGFGSLGLAALDR